MKLLESESGQEQAGHNLEADLTEMQGQPLHHENQIPAQGSVSATATMDEQSQQPAAPSTAPQIRSRITVVCAECKRLKLKCDRRTPCGSCTKRDTVARCIYSPAAAEKVDLHSLNNRLIQVEAILAMVTAGKTPPPFQSSYPLAQVALPTSHSVKPRASHATSSWPASSISIQLHDLVNIWLAHCQLDLFAPGNQASSKSEVPSDGAFVKLEPSPVETLQLGATPYHDNTIMIDEEPLTSTRALPVAQHNLPPLHIYYPAPIAAPQQQDGQSSQYTYPTHNPYPTDHNSSFLPQGDYESRSIHQRPFTFPSETPSCTRPVVTPALLALLPPPPTRTKLLASIRSARPYFALLVNWARVTDFADPDAASAKERQKALASAVFFGRRQEAHSPSPAPPSNKADGSLPLFACLCYLLAIGALEPSPDAPPAGRGVDHGFLYALAGQAMGVWEEYKTSLEVKEAEESREGGGVGRPKPTDNEREDMDFLLASLLQVKYLLIAGFLSSWKDPSSMLETTFPLIGKLVNLARRLRLAQDPEEDVGIGMRRNSKAEERRRMVWWEIMFYDVFTSDALNHAPLVTSSSYTTKIPAIAQVPVSGFSDAPSNKYPSLAVDGIEGGDDNDFPGETLETAESIGKPTRSNGMAKGRTTSRSVPPPKGKGKGKASTPAQTANDADHGFFGVRCRLTRLAQIVKHRLFHPGCECCTCGSGYTLDQAAKLEAEIRAWAADLPASLKFEAPSSTSDLKHDSSKLRDAAVAAELAIMANRLIISAYLPLMRPPPEISTLSSACSAAHPWSPASRATVDAAQGVVRAARELHRLTQAGSGAALMGEYYPLEKAVVDALVICAHSGIATGKPGRVVMEEVIVALEMLGSMGECEGELGRIVASLRRKVEAGEVGKRDDNTLKRKHHVLEGEQGGEMGPRVEGMGMAVEPESPYGRMDDGCNEPILSASSQQHQQHRPVRPPTPQRSVSVPRSKSGDKKNGKKSYTLYPTVGVRDRGKEGAPWMAKKSNMSPTKPDGIPEPRLGDLTSTPTGDGFQPSNAPHQIPPAQNGASQLMVDTGYRSRSSSITQAPRMQAAEYSMQFGRPEERHPDMHASQRRRFSIHENGQQQQQHQPEQRQVQPFTISPTTNYNHRQQPSRAGSYDAPRGYEQHRGSFDQNAISADGVYGGESSPYPNSSGAISTASSPYGSSNGHPLTPTFGSSSHGPSPPTFGPQPTVASPQSYFNLLPNYETPYDGGHTTQHQQHGRGGMSTEISMPGQSQANSGDAMGATIPSTPIYEKSQQLVYDVKPPMNLAQPQPQHQLQHYQMVNSRATPVESQHHMSLNGSAHHTWTPTPQYIQPQPIAEQHDTQYWNTGAYHG